MDYHVRIEQIEPVPIVAVNRRAPQKELSRVVPAACGEVWNYVRSAGVQGPGRLVAIYLDCEINMEIGVEVSGPVPANDQVINSATPGGNVATTVHMGPYNQLGAAHKAITDWCQANGHEPSINWEVYGHWNDDPAKVRSDVYYLLGAP